MLMEGVDLFGTHLYVDGQGRIVTEHSSGLEHLDRQQLARENVIDVLAEYRVAALEGLVGPSLTEPRPLLRIVPGKLAGEPHVVDTRVSTTLIDALMNRGYSAAHVLEFYPFLSEATIDQSRSLEDQLRGNLRRQVA
jgi:uncharacterized protein (DUF433 family)